MKNLRPQEVDVLTYANGAHMTFGVSSPRARFFWMSIFFDILVYCKKAFRASL
jgi:hypothetical protein